MPRTARKSVRTKTAKKFVRESTYTKSRGGLRAAPKYGMKPSLKNKKSARLGLKKTALNKLK